MANIIYKKVLERCFEDGIDNDGTLRIEEGTSQIEEFACRNLKNLKHLIIPDGVKFINHAAFYNCKNLKTVEFQTNKTKCFVGPSAFAGCENLETVILPSKVQLFHSSNSYEDVFEGCTKIQKVLMPQGKIIDHNYAKHFPCRPVFHKILPDENVTERKL